MADDRKLVSAELLNIAEGTTVKTTEMSTVMPCLSSLESSAIVSVLQESSDMLQILKFLLPNKQWNESYKSLIDCFMHVTETRKLRGDKLKESDLSMSTKVQQYR